MLSDKEIKICESISRVWKYKYVLTCSEEILNFLRGFSLAIEDLEEYKEEFETCKFLAGIVVQTRY